MQRLAKWHAFTKIKEMKVYGDIIKAEERSSLLTDEREEDLSKWYEK